MAKKDKNKVRKPLSEAAYEDLDRAHLIEHAKKLGGKKGAEAVKYLQKLNEKIEFTAENEKTKREELKKMNKRKRDKQSGLLVEINKPLYATEKAIDKRIKQIKETPKLSFLIQRRRYCEKYYSEIIPEKQQKIEMNYDNELAAALAELETE